MPQQTPGPGRPATAEQVSAARLERWASRLGYAGVLPVFSLLAVAWLQPQWQPLATRVGTIYVATIVCFLGGIQWGYALLSTAEQIRIRRIFVSILPSLWALIALLLPAKLSIVALIVGLGMILTYEIMEQGDEVYPTWYLPLRIRLTTLLVIGIGAFALLPAI
ncbi:MAG: DUF3429 domain-containing protein [Pseudomonadaceae bacterium]|nr:DUF3429 domain-containing protein [Pseudomonadaceae bacterium]